MNPDNESVLINLLLAGLLGLVGQGLRIIVGLKKLKEEAATVAQAGANAAVAIVAQAGANAPVPATPTVKAVYDDLFDGRKLGLSLFIGFIAGCLANLARDNAEFGKDVQLAMVAAGYAGTDFIEGVFKKILPGN